MNIYTHLEDLSNEIFFEIFDHLNALDIFTSFTLLNKRISSILQSIPLRIVIVYNNSRRQIDFLSSHLTSHAHQVISIKTRDTIRDDSFIISLLFNRHKFINLESCICEMIDPLSKLENFIKQIQSLNRLVSFRIDQPQNMILNESYRSELTRTMLMHKSLLLHSLVLQYSYDYPDISNYTSISSYLKSPTLIISGSSSTVSIYSILSILRYCYTIEYLCISLQCTELPENNNNINFPIQAPPINDNDLPLLLQLLSFELTLFARCDSHSIFDILRCMPNLFRFHFTLVILTSEWPFPGELLDGFVWKEIFELYVPSLSKFEFHMSIFKKFPILDLDIIINSFEYFVGKYSNWQMVINRWMLHLRAGKEYIMLRTLNYHKCNLSIYANIPFIDSIIFETRSTTSINDHSRFYMNEKRLRTVLRKERSTVTWSSSLFPKVTDLVVYLPITPLSWWNHLINIVNFREIFSNDDDARQCVIYLSHFVHLPNVNHIEFQSLVDISRWKHIQFILHLNINTRLLVHSKFIDNLSLVEIFKQIKIIESTTENIYFPSNFPPKLVRRFSLLSEIELQVYSFDHCVFIIEIFLAELENLSYIRIDYSQDTLLDDPFTRDYIIEKRRKTFPNHDLNEQMVDVKNDGERIEIRLK